MQNNSSPKPTIEYWHVWTDNDGIRVESMEDIIPRTSELNLGVRLSPHPASDVLSF
ncbi:hypothetical protein [Nostoc sp.]